MGFTDIFLSVVCVVLVFRIGIVRIVSYRYSLCWKEGPEMSCSCWEDSLVVVGVRRGR